MLKKLYSQQKTEIREILAGYPKAMRILLLLFIVDLFFVLLHFYSLSLPLTDETKRLRLDMDFGYSEMFQYLKFITIALILFISYFKERIVIYLIWSLFFLFLCVDDAFALHESFGAQLVKHFDVPSAFGLRGQDFGELAVVAILGLIFAVPFLYNLFRGSKKAKRVTFTLMFLMGILVIFGVFGDLVHSLLKHIPASGILTVIEDAGELFAVNFILWYTLYLYFRGGKTAVLLQNQKIN